AGRLAVAGECGGEDVIARGELVEERVVGEQAARPVEEHHGLAAARLQHAAARAATGLDGLRFHCVDSRPRMRVPRVIASTPDRRCASRASLPPLLAGLL